MRRCVIGLVVVGALATALPGCSGSRRQVVEQMHVVATKQMAFERVAPPRTSTPGIGASALFFFDEQIGFAATTGGSGYLSHIGYVPPREAGRIQRTTDGGATWTTMWSKRAAVFDSITFTADHSTGLASGSTIVRYRRGWAVPRTRPLLLTTHDGGRSWHAVRSTLAYLNGFHGSFEEDGLPRQFGFQLASSSVWFAFFGDDLRRSAAGGRTWPKLGVPDGTTMVRFLDERVGFAAAARYPSAVCRGSQQLWKTLDGASTWRPLPGTCTVPPYSSLDFLSERVGFTSASYGPDGGRSPYVIVRATRDGGTSWDTRYVDRKGLWPSGTTVHFTDANHGWAVSHMWQGGATFDELHVSRDGGRTWRSRPIPSAPLAFAGASAWAGDELGGPLWRTSDRGRTWQMSVAPERIGPLSFEVAHGERLVIGTLVGTIESLDGGHTWRTRQHLSPLDQARASAALAFIRPKRDGDGSVALVTRDRGRTWRALIPVPSVSRWDSGDAAFTDPDHGLVLAGPTFHVPGPGLPVYATSDGGESWRRLSAPPSFRADTVAIAPGVVLVTDYSDSLRLTLGVSVDGGAHWQKASLPIKGYAGWECTVSAPTRKALWVTCTQGVHATLIFRSDDGGSTWTRLAGAVPLDSRLIALDTKKAWAIGDPSTSGDGVAWEKGDAALWHTTDGGLQWNEVWPQLAPTARVYAVERELIRG